MDNEEINTLQLKRITDATETLAHNIGEILQLVKADQERSRKYMEDAAAIERQAKSEQATRASNGPRLRATLAMAQGPGTMLQEPGGKLQASSCKLDKIKL